MREKNRKQREFRRKRSISPTRVSSNVVNAPTPLATIRSASLLSNCRIITICAQPGSLICSSSSSVRYSGGRSIFIRCLNIAEAAENIVLAQQASLVYSIDANSRGKTTAVEKWGRGELRNSQPLTDFHDFRTFQRAEISRSLFQQPVTFSARTFPFIPDEFRPPFGSNEPSFRSRFPEEYFYGSRLDSGFYRCIGIPPCACYLEHVVEILYILSRCVENFYRSTQSSHTWHFEELCTCLSFAISVIFIPVYAGIYTRSILNVKTTINKILCM